MQPCESQESLLPDNPFITPDSDFLSEHSYLPDHDDPVKHSHLQAPNEKSLLPDNPFITPDSDYPYQQDLSEPSYHQTPSKQPLLPDNPFITQDLDFLSELSYQQGYDDLVEPPYRKLSAKSPCCLTTPSLQKASSFFLTSLSSKTTMTLPSPSIWKPAPANC